MRWRLGLVLLVVLLVALPATAATNYGTGKFYIVGMGVTDDLITVRGLNVVRNADIFLLEDRSATKYWGQSIGAKTVWICPDSSRYLYGADLEKITDPDVRAFAVRMNDIRNTTIAKIKQAVSEGKTVAALQAGDPMMFGITWYMELLLGDFPKEIVPGVGAFNACSAALQMSPPYGVTTNSVILTMFNEWPGREDTSEKLMASHASLMFYSMGNKYPRLFDQLRRYYPADTPVAVVCYAGDLEKQKVIRSTVGRFMQEVNYRDLPNGMSSLLVGKFITCGQARKEFLVSGQDFKKLLQQVNEAVREPE